MYKLERNELSQNINRGHSLLGLCAMGTISFAILGVIAPMMIKHVESANIAKDEMAMSEVMSSVELALADENVLNEISRYSALCNFSCYADMDMIADGTLSEQSDYAVVTKQSKKHGSLNANDFAQWNYTSDARADDEEVFTPAGNMRGVTLTFVPEYNSASKEYEYVLKDGLVNKFKNLSTRDRKGIRFKAETDAEFTDFEHMVDYQEDESYLLNAISSTVGTSIPVSSKKYRGSDYTLFIRMGTDQNKNGVDVYGQWNGTNLG